MDSDIQRKSGQSDGSVRDELDVDDGGACVYQNVTRLEGSVKRAFVRHNIEHVLNKKIKTVLRTWVVIIQGNHLNKMTP